MTTTFDLFTCNYTSFRTDMGTAVRSSNGAPRWALKYPLDWTAPETFPPRAIMRLPQDTFRDRYRDHLNTAGLDVIASRFRAIAAAEDDPRIVLLCFEKLETGSWCHRTLFAEWWHDMTGETVSELAAGPRPPEAGLF